jgi:hypothetical protein
MGSFLQRKSVRVFRKVFRWFRILVLFTLFLLVAAMSYLHLVGLPDYLKRPLLRSLRQRGFEAQFTSAYLGWGPAIIIEHAAFSPTNQAAGPRLAAEWTQLALNPSALLRARLQVDSFAVRKGALELPVSSTNQPPLALADVNLKVTLPSTNLAQLNDSDARFRGIHFRVSGEVLDFLSVRDWKLPLPPLSRPANAGASPSPSPPGPSAWEILQEVRFDGTPEMNLEFSADGRDLNSLRASLQFTAPGARSPWGRCGPLTLRAACARLRNPGAGPFLQARLTAGDVATAWAEGRSLSAEANFFRDSATNLTAVIHLDAIGAGAAWNSPSGRQWVRSTNLSWDGTLALPAPDFIPRELAGTLLAAQVRSGWGTAGGVSLLMRAARLTEPPPPDPAWGRWAQINSFSLDAQATATNIVTPKLKLGRVALEAAWRGPQFTFTNLQAALDGGHLDAAGTLDAASREVHLQLAADFDPRQLTPFLTEPARRWMSQFDWESPPQVRAALRFILPPWTNRIDDWPEGLRAGVQLDGDFFLGRSSFRGIPVASAASRFSCSNRVWKVSGLRVDAPAGALNLDLSGSDATGEYDFRFDSRLDPAALLPLLTEKQQQALRQLSFTQRPEIHGEARGVWRVPQSAGFAGTIALTNFVLRGESVDQLNASLDFTNGCLRLTGLALARGPGRVSVPLATFDFASHRVFFTNALSTLDPEPVRRALGRQAPPFMRQVHFDFPPRVEASGFFTPGDDSGTDLHFVISGDRFHWRNLFAGTAAGAVAYKIRTVSVTNIQATVYGTGKLDGWITFQWAPRRGTSFRSDFSAKDIDLAALARSLTTRTNRLEGMLDGQLVLTGSFDPVLNNLGGHGSLHVHDALLWDIKLFGVFSPILNAIAPGAGSSRAREAGASFIIANDALTTDNLEIRSSGFRLLYRGSVDLEKRINARVEAHLLRDTPLFGPVFSWVLTPLDKLFEYRVTGTLDKPVTQPLYIPKPFLVLLRPFHSLKSLLPPNAGPSSEKPPAQPAP